MERVGRPLRIFRPANAKMAFARAATDHQRPQFEKTREFVPDAIDCFPHWAGHAFGQILVDEKEWLNRPNLSFAIFQNQEEIFELGRKRGSEKLIEAMIFQLVLERLLPGRRIMELGQSDDVSAATRERDGVA